MNVFRLRRGRSPLLISLPHDGSFIPDELAQGMVPSARTAPDTDWWVSQLYGPIAEALDASLIVPSHSRYVVDLNRPPDDASLYPGQNTTGLCPTVQFSGEPVYLPGQEPSPEVIEGRVQRYWQPYHAALNEEIARLRGRYSRVLLWEGHSIASTLPFLFSGELPAFNLGTVSGSSCRATTQAALVQALEAQHRFTWVANGRFKGGYITRHYGKPGDGIEAVQLEMAQCCYMDEHSGAWDFERAAPAMAMIDTLIRAALSAR